MIAAQSCKQLQMASTWCQRQWPLPAGFTVLGYFKSMAEQDFPEEEEEGEEGLELETESVGSNAAA